MDNDVVIKIENLSKIYKIYPSPMDRLKEAMHPFRKRYSRDFYALQDFSLEIRRGDTIGFLGKNGAGKSTLLKLITGVLTPTTGNIEVKGKIASLLELGAGFNPDMSGMENIYMNGMLMGHSREEMKARVPDIVAFADIGEFIDQPVKTYSSGMFARLAFSVNAFVEPDILIVDEALAVGDAFFQAKCIDKMTQMMKQGITVLFVSHDIGAVKGLCRRAALLAKGKLITEGTASDVVEVYNHMQLDKTVEAASGKIENNRSAEEEKADAQRALFLKNAAYQRIQNGQAEFYYVELLDSAEKPVSQVNFGQQLTLRMRIKIFAPMEVIGVGYAIRNSVGMDLVYGDSRLDDAILEDVKPGEEYIFDWKFEAALQGGPYSFVCAVSRLNGVTGFERCDFIPCALQFSVLQPPEVVMGGSVHLPGKLSYRKI